jgi:hypothetical protein
MKEFGVKTCEESPLRMGAKIKFPGRIIRSVKSGFFTVSGKHALSVGTRMEYLFERFKSGLGIKK